MSISLVLLIAALALALVYALIPAARTDRVHLGWLAFACFVAANFVGTA